MNGLFVKCCSGLARWPWKSRLRFSRSAFTVGSAKILGMVDPYRDAKDQQNRMAMGILPGLKAEIEAAQNPLAMAVRIAIAGNVIDMGVNSNMTESSVRESVTHALAKPFVGDRHAFSGALR